MLNQNIITTPTLISGGSDESNWDFAAVTSYLIDSTQQGVLIVDGEIDDSAQDDEDNDETGNSENDLSYPDSLATEIGSLQDSHARYFKLRWIWILMISVMVGIPTISSGFLFHHRQQLLQRNVELEREIKHMKEIAANAIVSTRLYPRERSIHNKDSDESNNSDSKFKLIDNCWFKAELELRECANEAKESFSETAEKFYDYFAGTSSSDGSNNSNGAVDGTDSSSSNVNYCALATDASETVAMAAVQVMNSLWSMWSEGWEAPVLQDAVEQTRDTIRDALPDQQIYSKHS
jgi:hypothetical protein